MGHLAPRCQCCGAVFEDPYYWNLNIPPKFCFICLKDNDKKEKRKKPKRMETEEYEYTQ